MTLASSLDLRMAKAAECGLTHQINAWRENAPDRVNKLRGGRCVLFGVMPSDQRVSIHTLPLHFGRVLTGSEGGQSRPENDIPTILALLSSTNTGWREFVSHRDGLSGVNTMIGRMKNGEVSHAILNF